ncbi:MAG TPA: N-acyl homoserine lactonase family protein [Actinomycetota bacterium]|jgi:glyoxylase-like metal-dependent hydrolase (beta-lactamase superfamily II)
MGGASDRGALTQMMKADDIQRLLLGYFTMPEDSSLPGQKIVVCAYLIHHPDGPILFDTGLGPHPESDAMYHPVARDVREELRRTGVQSRDVRAVDNCHLHVDHAGGNPHFPRRPIFVQQVEVDAAKSWEYTNPNVVDFDGAALELHDGRADVAPGVRIIATPGHTPGHQSLVVDTQSGRVVLAGQAFRGASDYGRAVLASRLLAEGANVEVEVPPWVQTIEDQIDPVKILFAHDLAVWERPGDVFHGGLPLRP